MMELIYMKKLFVEENKNNSNYNIIKILEVFILLIGGYFFFYSEKIFVDQPYNEIYLSLSFYLGILFFIVASYKFITTNFTDKDNEDDETETGFLYPTKTET